MMEAKRTASPPPPKKQEEARIKPSTRKLLLESCVSNLVLWIVLLLILSWWAHLLSKGLVVFYVLSTCFIFALLDMNLFERGLTLRYAELVKDL